MSSLAGTLLLQETEPLDATVLVYYGYVATYTVHHIIISTIILYNVITQ